MLFNKRPDDTSPERRAHAARPVEQAKAPSRVHVGASTQSVIDAWLTITGNLESQGDVRVEGQIAGDIRCANLVIGRDATVSGDIIADEAVVRGKVKGTIRANRVILQDTACVESAIYHKVLSIDEGASFDGQSCRRQQPQQEEEAGTRIVRTIPREVAAIETCERSSGAAAGTGLHSADA